MEEAIIATITVKFVKLHSEAKPPMYSTELAAGADLTAFLSNDILIPPMGRVLIPTGIRIELPKGFEAQVRPRSGLALHNGITVLNSPGTIDEDYRGELRVILVNFGSSDFIIKNGDRIAQLVISPYTTAVFNEEKTIADSYRSIEGFGSTGI